METSRRQFCGLLLLELMPLVSLKMRRRYMHSDSTEAGGAQRGRVCALSLFMSKKCTSCLGYLFSLLKQGAREMEPALTEIQLRNPSHLHFAFESQVV